MSFRQTEMGPFCIGAIYSPRDSYSASPLFGAMKWKVLIVMILMLVLLMVPQVQACTTGACCDTSTGTLRPAGYICDSNVKPWNCEDNRVCTGSSPDCPATIPFRPSDYRCAANSDCQAASYCTGTSYGCPVGRYYGASGSGSVVFCSRETACMNAAACEDLNPNCPSPTPKSASTLCHTRTTICENDAYCDGNGNCNNPTYNTGPCGSPAGPCETTPMCSGNSATCNRYYTTDNSRCDPPQGPCETTPVCFGNSPYCARQYLSAGTYCNASASDCFLDARCSGASALCQNNVRIKPPGTTCGNNALCSSFVNNTCDTTGTCVTAQCDACPNGYQGADCSCPGNPPLANDNNGNPFNSTCSQGIWAIQGNVYGSITVAPNTIVIINGNLVVPPGYFINMGTNSVLNITQCALINGTLQGTFGPKLPASSSAIISAPCGSIGSESLLLVSKEGCKDLKATSEDNSKGQDITLLLIFTVDSSGCKSKSNTWWIILVSVFGGVVIIAAVGAIVIAKIVFKKF